jgi:hypothetical protein
MNDAIHALAHVQKEIDKYRQEQVAFLAASRADSYDEYKKVCGVIRGLNYADHVIEDLVRKVTNDD